MANVNRVFLGGNLTKDPILSKLPGGTAVVDFRIATNRIYTDKEGQKREETCYIDCNAFGLRQLISTSILIRGVLFLLKDDLS